MVKNHDVIFLLYSVFWIVASRELTDKAYSWLGFRLQMVIGSTLILAATFLFLEINDIFSHWTKYIFFPLLLLGGNGIFKALRKKRVDS